MTEKSIVALYDDFAEAQRAVTDLETSGIPRADISVIANDQTRAAAGGGAGEHGTRAGQGAGAGAAIGTMVGGAGGLLAGLGMLAIPGIGPVVAAGPLVAALAGAGVGAAAGGLIGALIGLGVPEDHAHAYAEGVRRGGTLVTVRLDQAGVGNAIAIFERYAPVDVEERGQEYRRSGWERFDPSMEPYRAGAGQMGTRTGPPIPGQVQPSSGRIRSYPDERGISDVDRAAAGSKPGSTDPKLRP